MGSSDHRCFAAVYDVVSKAADRAGLAERRRRMLAAANGSVLEVGAGTGLNLPHYTDEVERVVMLEPDAAMRRRLLERMAAVPVAAEVHEASVDDVAFEPAAFDTVVCSLV